MESSQVLRNEIGQSKSIKNACFGGFLESCQPHLTILTVI